MSDQYIVSARKYRPQTFDTVIGQEHITTTLKNAIRNRHLAHAFLFCGPRGVGKTTCARILAKTINCENHTEDTEACGSCSTCRSFDENKSFNIFELDAASNNSVDDIRELVSQVRFAPQQGKYKIYIIDEVHMLSTPAFNAFLKTLEEPPPYAIFILATTEKHKILPTILSRCQIFDFKRITTGDTVRHLESIATREHMMAEEAALHVVAQKSEGCMRDALSMLDRIAGFTEGRITYNATMEHLNMLDADFYFRLTDALLSQDVAQTLLLLDEVLVKGFEGNVIMEGMEEHMRNLLLCKDKRMAKLLDVPDSHKPIFFEKALQMPASYAISALNVLNAAEQGYKNSNNKRLHLEMCFIRLCYLMQAIDAPPVVMTGDEKKKSEPINAATTTEKTTAVSAPQSLPSTPETPVSAASPAPQPVQPVPISPIPAPSSEVVPSVPTTLQAPPETTASQTPPASRRINKNLLTDLGKVLNDEIVTQDSKEDVTDAQVTAVFESYMQLLRDEKRSVLHSHFSSMTIEFVAGDEVRFVATSEMAEACVKDQKNFLSDYFQQKLGTLLRITSEIRVPDNTAGKEETKVLSKQEKYQLLIEKNPDLAIFYSELNLQIDF